MKRVGIIGLGKMGGAMARGLLKHGYEVAVWNRTPGAVAILAAAGASPFATVASLVESVDVVIVSLSDDNAAREITFKQVIPSARRSQIIIECSTLSPDVYEMLDAEARLLGVSFLAAPVLGTPMKAAAGKLTMLVGGSDEVFRPARWIFSVLADNVLRVVSPRAAGLLKLANNTVLGVVAATLGELLDECQRAGIDLPLAVDSLSSAFTRAASSKRQELAQT
jgi:3-hydroxyisobutyrate dehydrogenase